MKYLSDYDQIVDDPQITTDRPLNMIVHALHERGGLTFEVAALVFPVPSTLGLRGYSKISKLIVKLRDPEGFVFHYDRGVKRKTNIGSLQRNIHIRAHLQPALQDIAVALERIGSPPNAVISKSDDKEILWAINHAEEANADWMTNAGVLPGQDKFCYGGQNPNLLPLFERANDD